jgi:hypothetical protein
LQRRALNKIVLERHTSSFDYRVATIPNCNTESRISASGQCSRLWQSPWTCNCLRSFYLSENSSRTIAETHRRTVLTFTRAGSWVISSATPDHIRRTGRMPRHRNAVRDCRDGWRSHRLKKDLPLLWLIVIRPEPHLQYIFSRADGDIDKCECVCYCQDCDDNFVHLPYYTNA